MKQKNSIITAILNFFFMGLGYVYLGQKVLLGIGFTIGAVALTYVELSLQSMDMTLYLIMFGAVFLINTCFAIDGYRMTKAK